MLLNFSTFNLTWPSLFFLLFFCIVFIDALIFLIPRKYLNMVILLSSTPFPLCLHKIFRILTFFACLEARGVAIIVAMNPASRVQTLAELTEFLALVRQLFQEKGNFEFKPAFSWKRKKMLFHGREKERF